MVGKLPESPPSKYNPEFLKKLAESNARAMNMRRDEWGVYYASPPNAYSPPKPRTNAIGIPLIKATDR